jgi:hypothetical protein
MKEKRINFSTIPMIKKENDHFILMSPEEKQKQLRDMKNIILDYVNYSTDAMVLAKSMVTIENPHIISAIKTNIETNPNFDLFESVNLMIFEGIAGTPVFQFGEGLKNIGDQELFGGLISALTSIFFTESKIQFDSFKMEGINFSHGNTMYIYRLPKFIICFLWNDQIGLKYQKSLEDTIQIVHKFGSIFPTMLKQ